MRPRRRRRRHRRRAGRALILYAPVALAAEVELRVADREDGDPIEGALVSCRRDAGTHGRSVDVGPHGRPVDAAVSAACEHPTDARGRAVLDLPDPGPWTLTVEAPGFRGETLSLPGPPGQTVRVWLEAGDGPLEIVVEGLRLVADPTRYVVDGEQAEETPGTLDDAVRLAQSLPGVTVQREYSPGSGDLSVRGSAPGDSRYFLDGIEIPYLYHYNQYASVFPASQIGELALYPSTFSARYGDAVGAVVDARSRLEPPEALHGGASLNFVMASVDASAPLRSGWWVSGSARRSYQDLAGERSAQYTVWPTFGDWVVRAEHGDEGAGIGVFAFGANDRYTRAAGDLDLLDPIEAASTPYVDFGQNFQVVGTRGRWSGPRRDGQASGGLVHHRRDAALTGLGGETLDTLSATSRLDATFRPDGPIGADVGYAIDLSRTSLVVEPAGPAGVRIAEEAPALARGAAVDDALLRAEGGVYGTAHLTTGALRWMPGVRLEGDSAGRPQVEPRAAVRASLGEQTMLKLAGGRYAQGPPTELLLAQRALPTTTSWQVSAGWEQTVAGRLELGLEAYRKWLVHPIELPIDRPAFAVPRGEALGVELLTRYRIREVVFLWGWLAVQRTTLEERGGVRIPADGDQRVSGGVVLSWDLGRLNLGARYRFASGLPYTPVEGSIYDGGADAWLPIVGRTNAARLPDYHKVDLRAAYTWALRGWTLSVVAEIWYVPPSSAQLYPTWNYDYTEQDFVVGPTLLPLLGVRARF